MLGRLILFPTIVGAVLFVSCSANNLLSPLGDQSTSQVTVSTISAGTMVGTGDQIPLSLKYNASQVSPNELKVELLDAQGTVVQTGDFKGIDFSAPLPPIQLPNLSSGTYTLRLTLYDANNQVIIQKNVTFFYTPGAYSLQGITSYPPTLAPGGAGILYATLSVPSGSNPYLRWTMGTKVIAEGYLQDGYDKVQWTAPGSPGVYSVTVELFPFGPAGGSDFSFSSPYSMHVEIFVTSGAQSTAKNQLGPASDYYSLFHFGGNLSDSSARGQSLRLSATPIGNPQLGVNGSVFGYQLDGTSGFKIPSLILPLSGSTLAPFSITMRLRLDSFQFNRSFFTATSEGGGLQFRLATNAQGRLAATVNSTTEGGSIEVPTGELATITLSVIPAGQGLNLLWFVDGNLSLSDTLGVSPTIPSPASGSSIIGGENGFVGLIDELGVYYRNDSGQASVDSEVFRRAMSEEYGSNLVFAEGFDGTQLPQDLKYDAATSGDNLRAGSLLLEPKSSVSLPSFAVGEDAQTLAISLSQFPQGANGTVVFAANGRDLASFSLGGGFDASHPLRFRISRTGNGIQIAEGTTIKSVEGNHSELNVRVTNSGSVGFSLRSFLIVKSGTRLGSTVSGTAKVPQS